MTTMFHNSSGNTGGEKKQAIAIDHFQLVYCKTFMNKVCGRKYMWTCNRKCVNDRRREYLQKTAMWTF